MSEELFYEYDAVAQVLIKHSARESPQIIKKSDPV